MKLTGKTCQCPTCGEYFSCDAAFCRHRSGQLGKQRCLDSTEMLEIGMWQDNRGVWRTEAKSGGWHVEEWDEKSRCWRRREHGKSRLPF